MTFRILVTYVKYDLLKFQFFLCEHLFLKLKWYIKLLVCGAYYSRFAILVIWLDFCVTFTDITVL